MSSGWGQFRIGGAGEAMQGRVRQPNSDTDRSDNPGSKSDGRRNNKA